MIIREIIGRAFLLMRKARDRCVSDYLYTAVNAKGGGFITANTTLLHPEHIFLGKRTYINGGMIAASENAKIIIGDDCMVSYCVHIRTDMHKHDSSPVPMIDQGHIENDVIIGDNVWIGYGAQILSGVVIGSNVIVAAGAVVTKNVPSDVVVGGGPAKIISTRRDDFTSRSMQ